MKELKDKLKDDFISNVSHEIKTPLSVINNYTTALKDKDLPEKIRDEYIETIIDTTEKLSDLVSNILKLNKIENRNISPEKQEYDLCRQLSDCLLSFEQQWAEKEIELFVDIEDRVMIKEPFALLDVVWHNLLSNAFKFTGNCGKVSLIQTSTDEFIEVRIKDTGCGIDEETKTHIFDKFPRKTEFPHFPLRYGKRGIQLLKNQIKYCLRQKEDIRISSSFVSS